MLLKHRLLEQIRDGGEGAEGAARRSNPADINAQGNRDRLSRMEEISRTVDGRRSSELNDVDGERVIGRFQDGEFDDSEEARERAALLEDEQAEAALQEQRERAEAARLQSEGAGSEAGDGGAPHSEDGRTTQSHDAPEAGDERTVDGVKYYLTIVNGQERWLTMRQLREQAARSTQTEETLQRAEEALQQATQAALTPKATPAELPDERELENIILSASMGDEEAVRKLATIVRSRPTGANPQDVSRLVSQQIATQREVDRAESAQADFLGNDLLAPIFRQRLTQFAQERPKTKIADAYKTVGDQMRKDFAKMLQPGVGQPASKLERKRGIVNPPVSAGRQQLRQDDDREVPVADQIDAIAKSRGQERAHRVRRS